MVVQEPCQSGAEVGRALDPGSGQLPASTDPGQQVTVPVRGAEAVNLYEAPASRNYWAACSVSGLLIHAVVGSLGGWGSLRTNRSGWAA
jgi:hypothetical protein